MPTVTVRIPVATYEQARRLAAAEGRSFARGVASALDRYEQRFDRERMIAEYRASLERAYADPAVAAEEQTEIEAWDAVSLHDLARSLAEEGEDER